MSQRLVSFVTLIMLLSIKKLMLILEMFAVSVHEKIMAVILFYERVLLMSLLTFGEPKTCILCYFNHVVIH